VKVGELTPGREGSHGTTTSPRLSRDSSSNADENSQKQTKGDLRGIMGRLNQSWALSQRDGLGDSTWYMSTKCIGLSAAELDLKMFKRHIRKKRFELAAKLQHHLEVFYVHVREYKFALKPGKGTQDFRWVGSVAAFRYAKHSRLRDHSNKYVVSNIKGDDGELIYPSRKLRETLWNKATVTVELKRYKPGDKKTVWQLFAETPKECYKKIEIVYDGPMPEEHSGGVQMHSNHNGYDHHIRMVKSDDGKTYRKTICVPPGLELNFFFEVNKRLELSHAYKKERKKVASQMQLVQNVLRTANDPPPVFNHHVDLLREFEKIDWGLGKEKNCDEDDEEKKRRLRKREWEYKIPSLPKGSLYDELFANDWREIQLNDVIPDPAARRRVCLVLKNYWNPLQQIFRYNSSQRTPVQFMSKLDYMNFLGALKMYDKLITPSDAEHIFTRVNVPEDYGSDDELEGIGGAFKGGFNMTEQEDNPNNMFVRSEFLESLVRISLRKFPPPDFDEEVGLEKFLEEYVLKREKHCIEEIEKYRLLMQEEEVKEAFAPYLERLHKEVYQVVAGLDGFEDADNAISYREYASWLCFKNLAASKTVQGINRRQAAMIFSLPIEPLQTIPHLVWDSFLEMLTRLAMALFKTHDSSTGDAIQKIIECVLGGRRRQNRVMAVHHGTVVIR